MKSSPSLPLHTTRGDLFLRRAAFSELEALASRPKAAGEDAYITEEHNTIAWFAAFDGLGPVACGKINAIGRSRVCRLGALYTLPEWRRMGLALALIDIRVEYARGLGYAVAEAVTRQHGLYTRAGFSPIDRANRSAVPGRVWYRKQL